MSKGRSTIPDLDALESPLLSPTSLSGLGGVPGSAIAERIFNDPESWDDTSGDEGEYPEDIENDTLLWFAEEIEKLRIQSAGVAKDGFDAKRDSKEADLFPNSNTGDWKDIRRGHVRPISLKGLFEQSNDDFSKEIQQHLSKILESGKFPIAPRLSLSPPYTSSSVNTPSTAESVSTPLTSNNINSPSIHSASALSFLEYYGIYPDSPLLEGRKLSRKRTRRRSKDSPSAFKPITQSNETVPPSTPPWLSSVPPPGLGSPFQYPPGSTSRPAPPGLTNPTDHDQALPSSSSSHSRKNSNAQEGLGSGLDSPRSRPLPIATGASPPHATPISTTTTGNSPFRVRRLPSIPAETQPQTSSTPPPPEQTILRWTTPPPHSEVPTSAAFLTPSKSSAALSPFPLGSAMGLRTPSTARSPLGVPLGPRTRSRSGDAGRPMQTIQPC